MGSQYIGFRLPDEYLAALMSDAKPEESPSQAGKRLLCQRLCEMGTEVEGAPLLAGLYALDQRLEHIEERLWKVHEPPVLDAIVQLNHLLGNLDKRLEKLEKSQVKQRKKGFG